MSSSSAEIAPNAAAPPAVPASAPARTQPLTPPTAGTGRNGSHHRYALRKALHRDWSDTLLNLDAVKYDSAVGSIDLDFHSSGVLMTALPS